MPGSTFDDIAGTAARLFLTHGFSGVSLRAIAKELGIQAASLYHHCPDGKVELYVRSVGWFLDGYEARLLLARGKAAFPESLLRMAVFTLGDDHVDLRRIVTADLPNLTEAQQHALSEKLHEALLRPFVQEFEAAKGAGKARRRLDSPMAAACVLAIADGIGGLHLPPDASPEAYAAAARLVRSGITMLLEGTGPTR